MRSPSVIIASLVLLGVAPAASPGEEAPTLSWRLVANDAPDPGQCLIELQFEPAAVLREGDDSWELYFNFGRKPVEPRDVSGSFLVEHVNGDLHRITPLRAERAPGKVALRYASQGGIRNLTDAASGFYLVASGQEGQDRPVPLDAQINLAVLDASSPVAIDPSEQASPLKQTALQRETAPIVPQPAHYQRLEGEVSIRSLRLGPGSDHPLLRSWVNEAIDRAGGETSAVGAGAASRFVRLSLGHVSVAEKDAAKGDEAYRLEIDPEKGVTIRGVDRAGLHYGVQAFIALLHNSAVASSDSGPVLPACVIEDKPFFEYRGMHLDVGRNFQPIDGVKKLLDLMAVYRLNRFHFHLTDDEGWRLAIRGLPELVSVGARRGHVLGDRSVLLPSFGSGPIAEGAPGSGHYTREQFIGLLRYAADRDIQVVPEIDLPGHARAAIVSMRERHDRLMARGEGEEARRFLLRAIDDETEYESIQMWDDNVVDVRLDSTMNFVDHVVDDLVSMYQEAGLPLELIHFGGDEVPAGCWGDDPARQRELFAGFMGWCSELARSHGAALAGWEEVFLPHGEHGTTNTRQAAPQGVCYVWNNVWGWGQEDAGYRLANAGRKVVLCNATHLYFDLAHTNEHDEPGYYWAGTTTSREVFEYEPLEYFERLKTDRFGTPISPEAVAKKERLSPEGRRNVIGIQGHLWGENLNSPQRLEYMAFPRLLALSERAWFGPAVGAGADHRDPARGWGEYSRLLGEKELDRLEQMHGGVAYRVPPVRVRVEGEKVLAFTEFPGLALRYTTDGSDPTAQSPLYKPPLTLGDGPLRFRAFSGNGRGGRVTSLPDE